MGYIISFSQKPLLGVIGTNSIDRPVNGLYKLYISNETTDFGLTALSWNGEKLAFYPYASKFKRATVSFIQDSTSIYHYLNTTKLSVTFLENGTKEINMIDWVSDTPNSIKLYLPIRDKPSKYVFTGTVLFSKFE